MNHQLPNQSFDSFYGPNYAVTQSYSYNAINNLNPNSQYQQPNQQQIFDGFSSSMPIFKIASLPSINEKMPYVDNLSKMPKRGRPRTNDDSATDNFTKGKRNYERKYRERVRNNNFTLSYKF